MEPVSALEFGIAVDSLLRKTGTYGRVSRWLARRRPYPVLVVGASGVGKTSLLKALCGEAPYIRREDRSDDVRKTYVDLNNLYIKLIDTPGEEHHEPKRHIAYQEAMKEQSIGIINVVSYGYHEGKARTTEVLPGGQLSEAYLEWRREVEIKHLGEWTNLLCGGAGPAKWVTTVATKADLWWQNGPDQQVVEYYDSEPYRAKVIKQIPIPYSVKSYSALSNLFYGLHPMSGYYTDLRRIEDHAALIAHILDKASKHAK